MAADIAVAAVIRKAVDITATLVIKEGSLLYWLPEEIKWIQTEMGNIQSYLADADAKKGGNQGIKNFINNIRDLAYEIEDIMDAYTPLMTMRNRRRGFKVSLMTTASCIFSDWYTRHHLAMKIKKIRKRVEDIKSARVTYGITESGSGSSTADTWDERRTFPHIHEPNIVGFDERIENLKAKLLSTNLEHSVISIVGMPGLGKTTLATKVYNSVKSNFECSAWICASQDPIVKNLLQDVARQVGLEKEKWEQDVERNLSEFLRSKRYVIVVDDIWDPKNKTDQKIWDALKVGIPTDHENGSRTIITSRDESIGMYIGGDSSLHKLDPLNTEDSWELFSKLVMDPIKSTDETRYSTPELENLGRQITERCGGVPLAIVVAAGVLLSREKTKFQWELVLESMGQEEDRCSKIFALSYKDLPIELKPCFLYLGIFPKGHEISAFQLINMWVAERFVEASGVQLLEDVGEDYLNQLIARNLVQVVRRRYDGRIKSCRIHDLLHNLCILEAMKSNFFNICGNVSNTFGTRVRRVSIVGTSGIGEYISLKNQTPKLRALLFFNSKEELESNHLRRFLGDFRFLRVLSIECKRLRYLPNEIGSLSNLSYFEITGSGSDYVELPSTMGNLKKLLTLNIKGCPDIYFPTFIWKMKQLRHVLLPNSFFTFPVRRRSSGLIRWSHKLEVSLSNLQTLEGVNGYNMQPGWLRKLTNIRKLVIYNPSKQDIEVLSDATPVSEKLEYLVLRNINTNNMRLNLSRYQNLLKLRLEGDIGKFPKPYELPPNLTKLVLKYCNLKEGPLDQLKNLPKLKFLKISGSLQYFVEKMTCSGGADSFPQLQVLSICGLPDLEEISVEEGGMPTLKKLQVNKCYNLTKIPKQFQDIIRGVSLQR